ncbi:unnamed protein product [Blumeria hordei]|uniref:Uncharacterized protein n=1 Tax=Blumeria hordei TaxID=2867405 RepID=A0A383UXR7_BLUHO|nr:unnamed protein product [Blumeria hordei]
MHKESERLALVGLDKHDAIYSVFEPKISGQFPSIGPEHDILATNSRVGGPGTYVKAYCSRTLGNIRLERIISHGLDEVTNDFHRNFGSIGSPEMDCLGSIRKFKNERRINSALSLQHLMCLKECSAFLLATLAFRRMLSVSGAHWTFAPFETQNLIPVNADRPIELSSVILSNHFFGKELPEEDSSALAWYMGHLHVLKLSENRTWSFLTIIGLESESGKPIMEYLVQHQRMFKIFSQKLVAIEEECRSKRRKPLSEAAVSTIYSETRQKLKEVISDFDFGKLPTSSPNGFIV